MFISVSLGRMANPICDASFHVIKLTKHPGLVYKHQISCKWINILLDNCLNVYNGFLFRDKSNTPSGFTLKLRKHIRTRRLEDVRQLGYDRVTFG